MVTWLPDFAAEMLAAAVALLAALAELLHARRVRRLRMLAFGPGGRLAELIGEAQFAIAPLTDVDAEDLVLGGKAGRLVRGFRGGPPSDAGALAEVLMRLAVLGEDFPEVAELDLNPVLGLREGCVAVDVRIRVASPASSHQSKTW